MKHQDTYFWAVNSSLAQTQSQHSGLLRDGSPKIIILPIDRHQPWKYKVTERDQWHLHGYLQVRVWCTLGADPGKLSSEGRCCQVASGRCSPRTQSWCWMCLEPFKIRLNKQWGHAQHHSESVTPAFTCARSLWFQICCSHACYSCNKAQPWHRSFLNTETKNLWASLA